MEFENYFPIWNKLSAAQQNQILGSLITRKVKKGTVIHNGSMDCTGLLLIKSGQLRAYILSDVMWLIEQIMWKSLDKRVAAFLPEESAIELTDKDKLEELSEI